jgi:hypothetical protein
MKGTGGCLTWLITLALLLIFGPVLYYFCGWLTGLLLQMWIGDTVINGMNYLFNTNRFTVDMLPTICGTLGVIGSFFKSSSTSHSSK